MLMNLKALGLSNGIWSGYVCVFHIYCTTQYFDFMSQSEHIVLFPFVSIAHLQQG